MNPLNENLKSDATSLIQMYQAGYLDGYIFNKKINLTEKELWKTIREDCKNAFEFRFIDKMNKATNTRRNGVKKSRKVK